MISSRMTILIPFLLLFSIKLASAELTNSTLPHAHEKGIGSVHEKGIGPAVTPSAWLSHIPRPNKAIARAFLQAHNELRVSYGASPLKWDKNLARFARRWAYKMHSTCDLMHSHGPYGENLFIGEGKWTVKQAMDEWAEEVSDYNWLSNTCAPNKMCGHFTQMIWHETRAVGCGMARCNATHVFMTCNYKPGGNYVGRRPLLDYQKFVH